MEGPLSARDLHEVRIHRMAVTIRVELPQHLRTLTDAAQSNETEGEENTSKPKPEDRYTIDVDTNATEAERANLQQKIDAHAIDSFIWLTDDAITSHKVAWTGREIASSRDRSWLSDT